MDEMVWIDHVADVFVYDCLEKRVDTWLAGVPYDIVYALPDLLFHLRYGIYVAV
jgi:hypothetical protein